MEVQQRSRSVEVVGVQLQLRWEDLLAISAFGIGPNKKVCLVVVRELCQTRDAGLGQEDAPVQGIDQVDIRGILWPRPDPGTSRPESR